MAPAYKEKYQICAPTIQAHDANCSIRCGEPFPAFSMTQKIMPEPGIVRRGDQFSFAEK
jgi:hypothetical protein